MAVKYASKLLQEKYCKMSLELTVSAGWCNVMQFNIYGRWKI